MPTHRDNRNQPIQVSDIQSLSQSILIALENQTLPSSLKPVLEKIKNSLMAYLSAVMENDIDNSTKHKKMLLNFLQISAVRKTLSHDRLTNEQLNEAIRRLQESDLEIGSNLSELYVLSTTLNKLNLEEGTNKQNASADIVLPVNSETPLFIKSGTHHLKSSHNESDYLQKSLVKIRALRKEQRYSEAVDFSDGVYDMVDNQYDNNLTKFTF